MKVDFSGMVIIINGIYKSLSVNYIKIKGNTKKIWVLVDKITIKLNEFRINYFNGNHFSDVNQLL